MPYFYLQIIISLIVLNYISKHMRLLIFLFAGISFLSCKKEVNKLESGV